MVFCGIENIKARLYLDPLIIIISFSLIENVQHNNVVLRLCRHLHMRSSSIVLINGDLSLVFNSIVILKPPESRRVAQYKKCEKY